VLSKQNCEELGRSEDDPVEVKRAGDVVVIKTKKLAVLMTISPRQRKS
jgi:hypothetical protein